MGMEREFNPATHKAEYDKTEQELEKIKRESLGEKTKEDIEVLLAKRERLASELEVLIGEAKDRADEENKVFNYAPERRQTITTAIEGHESRIKELKKSMEDLNKEIEEITGKKIKQEEGQLDIETLKQSNEAFLSGEFHWFKNNTKRIKEEVHFEKPAELNYKTLSEDINEQKFGEYILNPDTQNIDFEKARLFIPDLSQFVGKPIFEVMEYVVTTYSATYHIPGIEYWKWIIENENKAPQKLKDGDYYYFPGSLLRCFEDGSWNVPSVDWGHDKFHSSANGLSGVWCTGYHVVLLEKEKQSAEK